MSVLRILACRHAAVLPCQRSVAMLPLRLDARLLSNMAGRPCNQRSTGATTAPRRSTAPHVCAAAGTLVNSGLTPGRGLHGAAPLLRPLHTLASLHQRRTAADGTSTRPPLRLPCPCSRTRSTSSMPLELVTKWRNLWLKIVGSVLATISGAFLYHTISLDVRRSSKKQKLQLEDPVAMPPRASSLTGKELVRLTGHFVPGDTILFGPCVVKANGIMSKAGNGSYVPFFQAIGYEVIVPFFCKETHSTLLVNIGWLEGKLLRRYLKYQASTLMAKDNVKDVMLVGSLGGSGEDKFVCWDGKRRSVTELAQGSQVEAVVIDVARGPFNGYGHPKAGECVNRSFVTWRRIKDLFSKETPKTLSECIYPDTVMCIRYEDIFIQIVFTVATIGIYLYMHRGGFGGTFYNQYRKLQAETAVSKTIKPPARRKQLKG